MATPTDLPRDSTMSFMPWRLPVATLLAQLAGGAATLFFRDLAAPAFGGALLSGVAAVLTGACC